MRVDDRTTSLTVSSIGNFILMLLKLLTQWKVACVTQLHHFQPSLSSLGHMQNSQFFDCTLSQEVYSIPINNNKISNARFGSFATYYTSRKCSQCGKQFVTATSKQTYFIAEERELASAFCSCNWSYVILAITIVTALESKTTLGTRTLPISRDIR